MSVFPNTQQKTLMELLTPKQFRVVLLVVRGLDPHKVGEILGTTEDCVKTLLHEIYNRVGVRDSTALSLRYIQESSQQQYDRNRLAKEHMELHAREVQLSHVRQEDQVNA